VIRGETRKFMFVVFSSFFFVLLGIVFTTLAFTISAINTNADTSIRLIKDQIREGIEGELSDYARMLRNPVIEDFFARGSQDDSRNLTVALFTMMEISLGDPYYLALISDGKVIASKLPAELNKQAPDDIASAGSSEIGIFRGKSGDLAMISTPLNEDLRAVVVVDMTKQIEEARAPFEDQKGTALWVSLVLFLSFLAVAILVAVLVIGRANARYITGPIKGLEERANRLIEGDTTQDIAVDEKSDYYALQALLDSMRRLLWEMDRKSDE
jgi:hypothetical protein